MAISLGDPSGIGPEVVARSLGPAGALCRPVVFGHWPSLRRSVEAEAPGLKLAVAAAIDTRSGPETAGPLVVDSGPGESPIDEPGDRAAEAQLGGLDQAVDAVLTGRCDALVTGPVSKALAARRCPGFTGHTEYLARRSGVGPDQVTMVFASDQLAVGLVSTHLPLCQVPAAVTRPALERTLGHVRALLEALAPGGAVRIGVAGLNPHAGEGGLLGDEEEQIIAPFCRAFAGAPGLELVGPVPAEGLFREALAGRYHGVVAMYHDQAMIPLKLAGVGRMVNVTMGLPFVRTSPDHGVAYDLRGTRRADPAGMQLAIRLAARLARV